MDIHARVLGVAQDAGVPHTGCSCPRCERRRAEPLFPACLGLVAGDRSFLIDATPAFPEQIRMLPSFPAAILLTHVHMGHVAGLLHLGPEACGTKDLEVFGTPLVCEFLAKNAPWELLVKRRHVRLVHENAGTRFHLADGLVVESVSVPHRDEYADTVAYFVEGPDRTLLYLPDIDAWDGVDLKGMLARCDVALLDGTFFSGSELPRQENVPHPPIEDTWARLDEPERAKVRFIHLNHTNPCLDEDGPDVPLARQGDHIPL
jgi:pyrroloquinoline quinone biosynthesis protein B